MKRRTSIPSKILMMEATNNITYFLFFPDILEVNFNDLGEKGRAFFHSIRKRGKPCTTLRARRKATTCMLITRHRRGLVTCVLTSISLLWRLSEKKKKKIRIHASTEEVRRRVTEGEWRTTCQLTRLRQIGNFVFLDVRLPIPKD